ncbi:helix-turn-helix domain-containing protein [Ruminococcus gauvreauii]|uniref:helix-turn-helix domain-containing protein n=1 Tax=Ruminococcus gauvreauii TaxID=438033 RepID=UPI0039841D20
MNPIRVMIAEDEIAIANLIKNLIDFERLNLEFIGFALNGQIAYEMILSEKPDIVITDISMPVMNGLELIEKSKDEKLPVHFIIISGLTYFNYALSAIKMGVEDYLLKPINQTELNDVLEKTILKIVSALQVDFQIQKLGIDTHLQTQKLRRSFIMDILYDKEHPVELNELQINEEYGFSFLSDTPFLMGITLIDGILELNLATQNVIIEQLMRNFQTEMKDLCIDMEVYNKNNQFIFLLNYDPDQESRILGSIAAIREDLASYLSAYEGLQLTISCGVTAPRIQNLPYSLDTAQKVLNARIIQGSQHVLFAKELLLNNVKPDFILSSSDSGSIRSCIEIRDTKKLETLLKTLFKDVALNCRSCPHLLLDAFCDALSGILSDFHQHKIISVNLADTYLQYCDEVEQYFTLKELILFTVSFIRELLPLDDETNSQENRQIQTAKAYIQEHFSENIKLEDVAEQIYLAPTYFGVLFKKEVGEPFSSYLTSVRIEKAKELLHDVRYNIAEIANEVGYQDKRYFSKLFKEQVGVTPKEYRKIYAN